jgi:arsenate reductase
VLFICQHNAGRSPLAAHLLTHIAADRFTATSAGISPARRIDPVVVEALSELGIDTGDATPRAATAHELATADIVVTMRPRLSLPGSVAGRLIEWEFPDPDGWALDGVRDLRDRILTQVKTLADSSEEGRPVVSEARGVSHESADDPAASGARTRPCLRERTDSIT